MGEEKSFEQKLKRLEDIVRTLENGTVELEESMRLYEEGKELTKSCRTQLSEAEQKVDKLAS